MSDVVDILMTGRDTVIERGHCKGEYVSADGRVCAKQAVRLADGRLAAGAVSALEEAARTLYPERTVARSIVRFNDHPDTTPGEVIDVFDYAIACEKEKLANG